MGRGRGIQHGGRGTATFIFVPGGLIRANRPGGGGPNNISKQTEPTKNNGATPTCDFFSGFLRVKGGASIGGPPGREGGTSKKTFWFETGKGPTKKPGGGGRGLFEKKHGGNRAGFNPRGIAIFGLDLFSSTKRAFRGGFDFLWGIDFSRSKGFILWFCGGARNLGGGRGPQPVFFREWHKSLGDGGGKNDKQTRF